MGLVSRALGVVTLVLLSAISCADQQNSVPAFQTQGLHSGPLQLLANDRLTIQDSAGLPLANATILIGIEDGNPFAGNILTSDANGEAHIPADWQNALPVTVQAAGFITSTLPETMPANLTIQLQRQDAPNEFEVGGKATDFGRLVTDGKVDFALMIPALSRENLLSFDLSTVISPKIDTIEIIGNEVNLPSNISLPEQRESFIFPITLDKPDYRAYFRNGGEQVLTATHGQFPLQRVVNDIRAGKSIFELINHFTFMEGGQKKLDIQGNLSGQDIPVNQSPFNAQVTVRAPAFPNTQQMVSLALVEQDGRLVPTDLKRQTANQSMNMKSMNGAGIPAMFSFLVEATTMLPASLSQPVSWFQSLLPRQATNPAVANQDFTRLSFAFMSAAGGVAPQFLPLINKPVLNNNIMTLNAPAVVAGLLPAATYLTLSEIETITTGNVTSERRTRLWEIWSDTWLTQVELPKIAFNKRPDRKYRWEVMFMAHPTNFVGAATPAARVDLNTISHVTRNALDL